MVAQVLAPQLADKIIEHVRVNRFPIGTHLPAQFLADLFGVSRIPVREALILLAKEEVVRSERNRGFFPRC